MTKREELREKIEELVEQAVYKSGPGNDTLISADVDELMELFTSELKRIGEKFYNGAIFEANEVTRGAGNKLSPHEKVWLTDAILTHITGEESK